MDPPHSSPSGPGNPESSSQANPELVIVMPVYNEEDCIARVCREWLEVVRRIPHSRLLVVDDGSRDSTPAVLDQLSQSWPLISVVHQPNAGHGRALLHGFRTALAWRPAWVFHVDSDDQFGSDDFHKLWELRDRGAFLLGYREIRRDPWHRLALTNLLRLGNLLLFGSSVRDANSPFRLIRADLLDALLPLLPSDSVTPNILLSVMASQLGGAFCETGVQHRARQTGRSSLFPWRLIRLSVQSCRELIRLRLLLWKRRDFLRDLQIRMTRRPD